MMCYPAIDALVKKVDTKYTLVTLAALRARELTDGAPALLDEDRKSTRLNSSHDQRSRMPSSA